MESCPVCHGDGLEAVWNEEQDMYDEVDCRACQGSGVIEGDAVPLETRNSDWPENQQMSEGIVMSEVYEAEVHVLKPDEAIVDAGELDIDGHKVPGEPRLVAFTCGDYDLLMGFLQDYFYMSPAEADIAIRFVVDDPDASDDIVAGICPQCGDKLDADSFCMGCEIGWDDDLDEGSGAPNVSTFDDPAAMVFACDSCGATAGEPCEEGCPRRANHDLIVAGICPQCGDKLDADSFCMGCESGWDDYLDEGSGDHKASEDEVNGCDHCGAPLGKPCEPECPGEGDRPDLDEGSQTIREASEGAWERKVNKQLAKQGLRLASAGMGEPGWYVMVTVDGETTKVWATDEPETGSDFNADDARDEDFYRMRHEGAVNKNGPQQFDESTDFDKFIDSTLIKEGRRLVDKPENNPQRRRAQLYQDRPANKVVYRRGPR